MSPREALAIWQDMRDTVDRDALNDTERHALIHKLADSIRDGIANKTIAIMEI